MARARVPSSNPVGKQRRGSQALYITPTQLRTQGCFSTRISLLLNPASGLRNRVCRHQGRSQGGAQGARAPPLSCRAMRSYERRLATHVVTLASCKLEFSVRASSNCYISCSTHKSAKRLYTSPVPCARGGPQASQKPIIISKVTY